MIGWEFLLENKWFYMKYIGKYSAEKLDPWLCMTNG
jgi:hypothetical protein